MIVLPQSIIHPVHVRILTADAWGTAWQEQKYWTPEQGGLELVSMERVALPATGEAVLRFTYGQHVRQTGGLTRTQAPELTGKYLRIQVAQAQERPAASDAAWQEAWLGGIEYHEDQGWPGATTAAGARSFRAVDLWAFVARRWVNREHNFAAKSKTGAETKFNTCRGFPSYNVSTDERVIGNLYNVVTTYLPPGATDAAQGARYHTWGGGKEAIAWTDAEAIQHQINRSRLGTDPWFQFEDPADLFVIKGHWKVAEGESVLDVVGRICDRRRGKGSVVFEWTFAGDTPSLTLKAYPPFRESVSWDAPDDSGSFLGSDAVASTIEVDLQGDHRCIASAFSVNERSQHTVDYLETVGEPIEIVCTLSYEDSTLQEGWDTATFESTFAAEAVPEGRVQARYDTMYSLHKLKDTWNGLAGDGNGNDATKGFPRCDDAGEIEFAASADVAPADYVVLRDLPLLAGYDYEDATASRYDALVNVNRAQRRDIGIYLRTDDDEYKNIDAFEDISAIVKITHEGILVQDSSDKTSGNRVIGDTGVSSLGSSYHYDQLVFTVALQLPHRVRFASGIPELSRRKTIMVPGLRLELLHHQAIWELDEDGAGKRAGLGGTATAPGIIRDDRTALAQLHALAWQWYGTSRVPATWALRCCGFLESFQAFRSEMDLASAEAGGEEAASTEAIDYQRLGQLVHRISANGQDFAVGTPITRIAYDHQQHQTTWSCDWVELDFA